ncbi:MAG: hypothetical protein MI757_04115 [Pirellulales bacterium]|nr:hypothetical protein [Pirellulales bacterium]
MTKNLRFVLAAAALSLFASSADAQYYGGWGGGYGPGYGYGTVQRRAVTPAESYAYGLSDVTRARSQANLTNAEALSTLSDVRGKEIQNNVDYANMYFERRRINEQWKESQRRPRATNEQLVRYAKDGMPDRSSGTQIDSITGEIAWPIVLQAPEFESYRQELDQLYKERAATGSVMGRDAYLKTRETCDLFLEALNAQVRELPANDFIEGKKFIEMLKYESKHPPG